MKTVKYFVLFVISALFLANCTIETDKYEVVDLSKIPDKLVFSDMGECSTNYSLPSSSSYDYYDIRYKSDQPWCSVSDELSIEVEANKTGGSRTATISLIFNGETVKTITVEQEAASVGNPDDYIVLQSDGIMVQTKDLSSGVSFEDADNLCTASRVGGYNDWRLPTREELLVLYLIKASIGGFSASYYWAAPYSGDCNAVNFNDGSSATDVCYSSFRVRAVRTLP